MHVDLLIWMTSRSVCTLSFVHFQKKSWLYCKSYKADAKWANMYRKWPKKIGCYICRMPISSSKSKKKMKNDKNGESIFHHTIPRYACSIIWLTFLSTLDFITKATFFAKRFLFAVSGFPNDVIHVIQSIWPNPTSKMCLWITRT